MNEVKIIKTLKVALIVVLVLNAVFCLFILAVTPLQTLTSWVPTPKSLPTSTPVPGGGMPTARDMRFTFDWRMLFYSTAMIVLMFAKFTWWALPILWLVNFISRKLGKKS